ncbi:DUF6745 domain-containing protein [Microseira sp. BLCC-F43]|jgi:hypothetical protein|uniref:DUF6745 domain-containing protein n=1 Tax=Microseira sp. BLCC-F43 TaxID=3153602 RepID=UPI0035B8CD2D
MPQIEILTPEQEALIPVYWEKWGSLVLYTEPIDRKKIYEAVKSLYTLVGKEEPEVIFIESPHRYYNQAFLGLLYQELKKRKNKNERERELLSKLDHHLERQQQGLVLQKSLVKELEEKLKVPSETLLIQALRQQKSLSKKNSKFSWSQQEEERLKVLEIENKFRSLSESSSESLWLRELYRQLGEELRNQLGYGLWYELFMQLERLFHFGRTYIDINSLLLASTKFDYCISVLNLPYDPSVWDTLQFLAQNCGSMIFPYKETCLVCDRPRILSFDNQQRLHAEGAPAIQFADGFSVYAYHGVRLPEKYGKIHPNQWQAEWLLSENNAELRRVLIQGIGYARICQELQATELDNWQEYTLLKIDLNVDVEPIYLLKMICPSTGYIHALRVPPDVESAREAIRWVNWGIDPEEFSTQT